MNFIFFSLLVIGTITLITLLIRSFKSTNRQENRYWENYRQQFGSIEALMALTKLDVNELRAMRDAGGLKKWDAINDVMHYEGVPEEIATEFIERL